MKNALGSLTLATFLLFAVSTIAADKVVVVPMGSGAKGTNGQVQYNDNGSTNGAEVYYDKATKKLESHGEMRTIDESGDSRLWGEGRPGVSILSHHTNPAGYCETPSGIKFALSDQYSTWANAAAACPAGTWVCTLEETGSQTCPTLTLIVSIMNCDGSSGPVGEVGWMADGYVYESGFAKIANYLGDPILSRKVCESMFVWCCWE